MATATKPKPTKSPFAEPGIWVILSHVLDGDADAAPLAIGTDALPPTGTPTLIRVPSAGGSIADAAAYHPLCLWVSSPVLPNGEAVQLYSYTTYGSTTPIVLTASTLNQPLTLTAPDPTNAGQVWNLVQDPSSAKKAPSAPPKTKPAEGDADADGATSPPRKPASIICQVENAGVQGAMRRSSTYAVPGSQLELGTGTDQDSHLRAYLYEFVRVG